MKFECLNPDCKKTFLYAAKHVHFLEPRSIQETVYTSFKLSDSIETLHCPFCGSLEFQEQSAASPAPKMLDMVECEVTAVKGFLDRGYVVIDRYAKSVRLALYEQAPVEAAN